jgi:hypothetical protein
VVDCRCDVAVPLAGITSTVLNSGGSVGGTASSQSLADLLTLEEFALPVVTKDDLIAMKRRAAADPKRRRSKALRDQADIALLEGNVLDPDEGW